MFLKICKPTVLKTLFVLLYFRQAYGDEIDTNINGFQNTSSTPIRGTVNIDPNNNNDPNGFQNTSSTPIRGTVNIDPNNNNDPNGFQNTSSTPIRGTVNIDPNNNNDPNGFQNTSSTPIRGTVNIDLNNNNDPSATTSTIASGIMGMGKREHVTGTTEAPRDNNVFTSPIPLTTSPTSQPIYITETSSSLYTTTDILPIVKPLQADHGKINNSEIQDTSEKPLENSAHTLNYTSSTSAPPLDNLNDDRMNVNRANRSLAENLPSISARHTDHRETTPKPNEREVHGDHDEDHTEVRSRGNLCAACLCDTQEKNIYCKHEHLYNGESHHLRLSRALLPPHALSLHIQGFEKVIITPGTFAADNLTLRKIHFQDIGEVELSNGSLHFSPNAPENQEVVVQFTGCYIPEFAPTTLVQYARSKDQHNDINLERTRFLSLNIERCNITTIRTHALYQARLLYFTMKQTKVEAIEQQGIYLDIYEDWTVERCHLPHLVTHAISLRTQRIVVFSRNHMEGLANRSLDILSPNQVLFEYNYVVHLGADALLGVRPYEEERGANIVFLNNTVIKADNRSLVTSRQYPIHERKILDNRFNIPCSCHIKEVFSQLLGVPKGSKIDHYLQVTLDSVITKSLCQRYPGVASYSLVKDYLEMDCNDLPIPIIVSCAVVLTAIIITIIVSLVCARRAQKAKEEANYLGECCYSQSFSTLHSNQGPQFPIQMCHSWERSGGVMQPWVMAVPEVKTYQETVLHMDYEHTESLGGSVRGSYPPEAGPIIDLNRKTQVRASCPFN